MSSKKILITSLIVSTTTSLISEFYLAKFTNYFWLAIFLCFMTIGLLVSLLKAIDLNNKKY